MSSNDLVGYESIEAALVAAQAEMPKVKASGRNPHFHSSYVTLDDLLAATLPVLNRHGLALSQFPISQNGGPPALLTILLHEGGGRLEYVTPLLVVKQDMQALGSAITYARRYALAAALGIAEGEDDDGNRAVAPPAPKPKSKPAPDPELVTEAQTATIFEFIGQVEGLDPDTDWEAWCREKVDHVPFRKLTKKSADKLIAALWEKAEELAPPSEEA